MSGSPPKLPDLPPPSHDVESDRSEEDDDDMSEEISEPDDDAPPPPTEDAPDQPISTDDDDDDDDDEEKDDGNWIEYTGPDGQIVTINMETREVQQEQTMEEMIEVAEEVEQIQKQFRRARRNSAITREAWGNENKAPTHTHQQEQKKDEDYTIETLTDALGSFAKSLRVMSDRGDEVFNDSTIIMLREATETLSDVHRTLEDSSGSDARDDVSALMDLENVRWNFENEYVYYYRSSTLKYNKENWAYDGWHIPETFSEFPLPEGSNMAKFSINLPTGDEGDGGGLGRCTVACVPKDFAFKAIKAAYNKCAAVTGMDALDFLLQVTGMHDFILPENNIFNYYYVRNALRNGLELQLNLVQRPEENEKPEDEEEMAMKYAQKIGQHRKNVAGEEQWQDTTSAGGQYIALSELYVPYRINILGIEHLNSNAMPRLKNFNISSVFVEAFLFHGVDIIANTQVYTAEHEMAAEPRWNCWMGDYGVKSLYDALPREVRLGFILWGKATQGAESAKSVMLGYVVRPLVNYEGFVCTGEVELKLWPFPKISKKKHGEAKAITSDFIYTATTRENLSLRHPAILRIRLPEFRLPVVAPKVIRRRDINQKVVGFEVPVGSLDDNDHAQLKKLLASDVLMELSKSDKALIWRMRHSLTGHSQMLSKFLCSTDWGNEDCQLEAHRMLKIWAPPYSLASCLELLGSKFPDYTVRKFAVQCLRRLQDEELQLYLLQLAQCLKFEPEHNSELSRYLIERALRSPYVIGHYFFWHLKAELHNPEFSERFGVVLEEYLSHCGRFSSELRKQNETVVKLQKVSEMVVRLKREEKYDDEQCTKEYNKELEKLNRKYFEPMGNFQIPLDPRWRATTLIVKKCRYMSSKMVPLWLVFNNADEKAPPIYIMFKSGDDLRQDILTLQMLKIMDRIWLGEGMDMKLKPYKCIATGVNDNEEGVGMIEIVLNSMTTSGIQIEFGGGALGALKSTPINLFIREHNKSDSEFQKAVDNFVNSCAGYCVATFVLGIGDRHNGNIMVTKDGHLFHIDFGHFLGNFKKKMGVNRERAAFVFTPEMAYVIGGKNRKRSPTYKKFLKYCSDAFRILRENIDILEILFLLMCSAGMPELQVEKDIHYMRDKLYLDMTDDQADKELHNEIKKSLSSVYRRIDNAIHNAVHG